MKPLSDTQKTLCKGADLVRDGLAKGGQVLGMVVLKGGQKVIKLIDKDDKEVKVNPKLLSMLGSLESVSK